MMKEIFKLINDSKSILILTHENPDGDAIGSAMAFYGWLSQTDKKVSVVIPEIPYLFKDLRNVDKVLCDSNEEFDLAIVVDCSSVNRIGQNNGEFGRCKNSIVVDHHILNDKFGLLNYIDTAAPACTQVIYNLFKNWNIDLDADMGEAILIGCLTDTNGFSNNNVNKETLLMVADIMDLGISLHDLYCKFLLKKSKSQYALMKMTTDRLEFFCDGKVVFSYISHEDMENVGAKKGDHEGLVDIGRNIEGVEISIFMREENGYNVSFRSNGLDVSKLAKKFGGGGHVVAAGAKLNLPFKEAKEALINETLRELEIDGRNNNS